MYISILTYIYRTNIKKNISGPLTFCGRNFVSLSYNQRIRVLIVVLREGHKVGGLEDLRLSRYGHMSFSMRIYFTN